MEHLTPKTADTNEKLCRLKRDNKDFGKNYSMMVEEASVTIFWEIGGEPGCKTIPKEIFNKMIKFYETGR